MALAAGALAIVAADQAAKAISDGIQQLDQGGPNYIRDGQPQSIPGQIGQAVARSACRRYGEGDFELSPQAAAGYELACRPYLDSLAPGSGPGLAKPFDGGQCEGVLYNVRVRLTLPNNPDQFSEANLVGPLRYNQDLPPVPENTGCNPGQSWNRFSIAGSTQSAIISWVGCGAGMEVLEVRRLDGLPDNCGNPQPVVIDPDPIPDPTPNPEPFNPGPNIDVDLNVELNFDGSINFNIGVGVPILIRPNFDFSPDQSGDGSDGGGGDGPPSPPAPEPGPELPGGNGGFGGDDSFGPPPAGRRWVGCCIRLTDYPLNQPPIPGSVPEDVFPQVVGNIRLVFNAAGQRQTDTPVRISAKHVCVWEPVAKLNPVGVNVDLLPGFGYVYTPYSVPLED